jgi:outer membrane protein assembly factor BamB
MKKFWHFLAPGVHLSCAFLVVHSVSAAATPEQNWPAWRGPLGNGVAPEANPPITWSETDNVKWKVKIPGRGSATPIIWNDRVFVQTAIPSGNKTEASSEPPSPADANKPPGGGPDASRPSGGPGIGTQKPSEPYRFVLRCLDRKTGEMLWEKVLREEAPHEGHHPADGTFASSSPLTDGQLVFAYFGSRGLHALDFQGNQTWSKDLGRMQIKMSFGEGSSPVLFGDTIVVNWDNEGSSFIAAFEKQTGKELWRQPRDEGTSWATPLVVLHEGKPQVITSATRRIRSYDLATGKLLWECSGMTANAIPCPVSSEGMVYALSGFRGNALLAIKLGGSGDLTGSDAISWKLNKNTPYVPSPLLYGDKLYFLSGNTGTLSCFETKTGQPLIDAEKIEALPSIYASPVGANGRVYLVSRNGPAVVLKNSGKLEVLATNKLDERFDASPAIAGNEIFLRGREFLYCLAEK